MSVRLATAVFAGIALIGGLAMPSPAEAQRRGGVAAGILAGAVVGAIVAGAANQAAAKPKPQRAPKSATRPRSRSTAQQNSPQRSGGSGNPSTIDGNATMQNASTRGTTQAGPSSKDPFASATPAQQASGQPGR